MIIPVILLNYNLSVDCRKCVSFLKRQNGVDTEIILVDNCSKEEDVIALRDLAQEQGCTLIENKENRGYNAGNNIGLRYASERGYKYALIANPDMEFPQPDYLARMVAKMEEDADIAVCASDIVTPEGRHQNPMREGSFSEDFFWPITILRNRKKKEWLLMDYTKSGYCEKVSGCSFMIRMSFVEEINFFDEGVFLYCEEPILAKQVARCGYKMYYMHDSQAIHRHIKSEKGDPRKRMKKFRTSQRYYLKNYSGHSRVSLALLSVSQSLQQWFTKMCIK